MRYFNLQVTTVCEKSYLTEKMGISTVSLTMCAINSLAVVFQALRRWSNQHGRRGKFKNDESQRCARIVARCLAWSKPIKREH